MTDRLMCKNPSLTALVAALLLALAGLAPAQEKSAPTTRPATAPSTRPAATAPAIPPAIPPAPRVLPAADLSPVLSKAVLETPDELRLLQEQVKKVVARVFPTVVGVRTGGFGSGVIVTDDGYVLTAGHVAAQPGRDAVVYLSDGRRVKARTLGINFGIDSGMVKITEPGPLPGGKWPFAEMGASGPLKRGQWCIAMGHPGGVKAGRTAPLRLGRVLNSFQGFVRTECTLVGGDSGGPLFDLAGRVIGIHSRIGGGINDNMHVPVDTYRDTWDKLARGETWGLNMFAGRPGGPYLGVQVDREAPSCIIEEVLANSPAAKAGLKAGDIVTALDGKTIAKFNEFQELLSRRKAGEEVNLEVKRGSDSVKLKVTLGRRPAN